MIRENEDNGLLKTSSNSKNNSNNTTTTMSHFMNNTPVKSSKFASKFNQFLWRKSADEYNRVVLPILGMKKTQIVYRFIALLVCLFLSISCPIAAKSFKSFVYFTVLCCLWTTITFLLINIQTFRVTWASKLNKSKEGSLMGTNKSDMTIKNFVSNGNFWKFTLILFEISIVSEIVVTIIFWTLLYHQEPERHNIDNVDNFNFHFMHILPILLLLIEFATNHWKFVFRHIIFTIAWLTIYGLVNCAYTLGTGEPIYKDVLEWKDLMTYVYCGGMIIIATVFHLIFTFISCLKAANRDKLNNSDGINPKNSDNRRFSSDS